MNFLSHNVVLPTNTPPLVRVATAIPDLWALVPKRPLPLVLLRNLRNSSNQHARLVGKGLDYHLYSDSVFHRLPQFSDRISLLAPLLRKAWPELRHAQLAAHVLVEMLLDRFLIRHDPSLLVQFYDAFTADHIEIACRLGSDNTEASETLQRVLSGLSSSRFLEEYLSNIGLISRFLRSLSRTPFAPASTTPLQTIADEVPHWESILDDGSFELLQEVRCAVALREFAPCSEATAGAAPA